jgi:hypothetical protein
MILPDLIACKVRGSRLHAARGLACPLHCRGRKDALGLRTGMYGPPPCCKRKVKIAVWSAQVYPAFLSNNSGHVMECAPPSSKLFTPPSMGCDSWIVHAISTPGVLSQASIAGHSCQMIFSEYDKFCH